MQLPVSRAPGLNLANAIYQEKPQTPHRGAQRCHKHER
jgi:hypothetical protein